MIFKSKDIDNIYVPDDEYFKEYAAKLAKESVARVVEKINSEWWPTLPRHHHQQKKYISQPYHRK